MLKLIDMASPIRTTSFCSAFYFFSFLFSVVGLGPVVYLLRVLKLRMSGCFLCLSSYSSVCCFDFLSKFISLSFSFYFEMPTMWDMPSDSFLSNVFGSPIIELADGTCFRLVMCCIPCGFLRGSSVLLLMFKFKSTTNDNPSRCSSVHPQTPLHLMSIRIYTDLQYRPNTADHYATLYIPTIKSTEHATHSV